MKQLPIRIASIAVMVVGLGVSMASAHVTVKPAQVGVGAFQTFTMGVPVEKDMPTTAVRLVMPAGLNHVTPNVKPGWTIGVKKEDASEEASVTEISWTGGSIPAGQRDEFVFSAQVPAAETTLQWKAYQTYQDGTVVSWDQDPNAASDHGGGSTPASQTKVVNDVAAVSTVRDPLTLTISVLALLASIATASMVMGKKSSHE